MDRWILLMVAALAVIAIAAVLEVRYALRGAVSWSPWRAGLGVAMALTAAFLGVRLVGLDSQPVPEQLGVAAVVEGVSGTVERGGDLGLFLAMHVTLTDCSSDTADVTLTLQPTAEFWIDHREELLTGGTVDFAVPDTGLTGIEVTRGEQSTVPLPSSRGQGAEAEQLRDVAIAEVDGVTMVKAEVPGWGSSPDPVTLAFTAPWVRTQSDLGACQLRLPALTGLPTALTAARMQGYAAALDAEIPKDKEHPKSLFIVSSQHWRAYYNPDFEVTRGITTIDIGDRTIDTARSSQAPTATTDGAPAWHCSSSIISDVGILDLSPPGSEPGDFMVTTTDNKGAFGGARVDELLDQQSCASAVAVVDPLFGARRDLVLLVLGALISLAVEFVLTGLHRRRKTLRRAG